MNKVVSYVIVKFSKLYKEDFLKFCRERSLYFLITLDNYII